MFISLSIAGHVGVIGCYSKLERETWASAQSKCAGLGGHVVAIESPEENIIMSGNWLIIDQWP